MGNERQWWEKNGQGERGRVHVGIEGERGGIKVGNEKSGGVRVV